MSERRDAAAMNRTMMITLVALAIIAFLSYAAALLKPVAFAVLLSFVLAPVSRRIQRYHVPRTAAAALTVLIALGLLGVIGYQVGQQLTSMAENLSTYERNLIAKLQRLQPKGESVIERTTRVVQDVTKKLEKSEKEERRQSEPVSAGAQKPVNVRVVSVSTLKDRVTEVFGPTLEFLGSGVFILILVFFMLINREDLTERLIHLVGTNRVSLTTKTLEEIDQRISRYLIAFALVNSLIGVVVGLGLQLIGVEYAALWGVLAGLLRFIPYVGPGAAFLLPFAFSIASAPGADWRQPLLVCGLFVLIEAVANSYLEPVIYGKTTGVTSFGLLVAALFWTWLWGTIGLLLSTPLTVCLAVLGKYVPALSAFATLLVEEPPLTADVQFYRRLMAMDEDGATALIDELGPRKSRAEVFDEVLIPALSLAAHDFNRGDLDESEQAYIWRVIGDLLDDVSDTPEYGIKMLAGCTADSPETLDRNDATILGIAANDHSDALALRMLGILLRDAGFTLTVIDDPGTPLQLAERVAEADPALAVLSQVPPDPLTNARYLVRRIRARESDLPLFVGRWCDSPSHDHVTGPLKSAGATAVVFRLAEACDRIVAQLRPPDAAATLAGGANLAPTNAGKP